MVRALRTHGYKQRYIGPFKMFMTGPRSPTRNRSNVKLAEEADPRSRRPRTGGPLPAKVPCGNG